MPRMSGKERNLLQTTIVFNVKLMSLLNDVFLEELHIQRAMLNLERPIVRSFHKTYLNMYGRLSEKVNSRSS